MHPGGVSCAQIGMDQGVLRRSTCTLWPPHPHPRPICFPLDVKEKAFWLNWEVCFFLICGEKTLRTHN